jgi:hypothetical protein
MTRDESFSLKERRFEIADREKRRLQIAAP